MDPQLPIKESIKEKMLNDLTLQLHAVRHRHRRLKRHIKDTEDMLPILKQSLTDLGAEIHGYRQAFARLGAEAVFDEIRDKDRKAWQALTAMLDTALNEEESETPGKIKGA